jgi:hypothetical protein
MLSVSAWVACQSPRGMNSTEPGLIRTLTVSAGMSTGGLTFVMGKRSGCSPPGGLWPSVGAGISVFRASSQVLSPTS